MNVVVTDPGVQRYLSILESTPIDVELHVCHPDDREELARLLPSAEVYVGARLTAEMVQATQSLRFVQVSGAGTDKIDSGIGELGVTVANVFEHGRSMAEYTLMAMLALSHDLRAADADLRSGVWRNPLSDPSMPLRPILEGRTVGLVGFGHIGRAVAAMCTSLGMRTRAVRRTPGRGSGEDAGLDHVGGPADLHDLLGGSDFVVVVVPLTAETRGMIAMAELDAMKDSAFLINVARGPVVDERALYEALRDSRIAGAGLDVWYRDRPAPGERSLPSMLPFGDLENVIMTPHISGQTEDTFRKRATFIAENLVRYARGQEILNVVAV